MDEDNPTHYADTPDSRKSSASVETFSRPIDSLQQSDNCSCAKGESGDLVQDMTDFLLPDDIICNIIARLPAKPLLRFRCVSRHWNHALREPNFMKLRSRKAIILPFSDHKFLLIDNTSNSIVKRCYPFDTRNFKLHSYWNVEWDSPFGMGSWSSWSTSKYNIYIKFGYDDGHFVNRLLYWIEYNRNVLIAINVKDMVLSQIFPPFEIRTEFGLNPLGTIDGYLCSLKSITNSGSCGL
ncbi:hypothetical protein L1987_72962 [Smallanthus sonchifolius]|uniref:Uncharacterized protein n=1 Tax=Smallanthus sonchifolius TaxID=185202 RepID=A0ACB9AYC1_9ASTR|nr:hypothetical protein L1987_72962 [Smallanthus sonchifolius]